MKKSILAVIVLLLIIATLPTIGNTFIKKSIDERLSTLKSFGLQTSKDESVSSYLNTSRHFEFVLKDSQSFLNYLSQYSDKQIPPYVNAMLDGVLIGADVKYSNLPFAKAFEIEIYPLKLSPKMSEILSKKDLNFYKYTENFLALQGVLYHIEYNLLNEDFKGYIKDITESVTLEDKTRLMLSLQKATFKGNGVLLAPNELHSKIKELHMTMSQNDKNLKLLMKNFKSNSNFESVNTYLTAVDVDTTLVALSGLGDDFNISVKKLRVNASSNEQGSTTQLNSKTSVKSLQFSSDKSTFNMKKFNFDVALNGLDKKAYSELTQLAAKNNNSMTAESYAAFQESIVHLFSKGIVLKVADLSLKEFSRNNEEAIKGFAVQSTLTVKEDKELKEKIKVSPLMAIGNIALESTITISKEMYSKLYKTNGFLARFDGYEKEDGDNYIFVLKFVDMQASINGRSIH